VPKRRERVAPPPAKAGWDFCYASSDAVPLRGSLGSRTVNGIELEQWQYEVTGAGRLWYCIDDGHRTVWLTDTTVGHPKPTE
jgi:hypothetical protein